jgi:hypothetical protein
LKAIKGARGITVRCYRGDNPFWFKWAATANTTTEPTTREQCLMYLLQENVHASEYSSVGLDYDYSLNNNGTIDSLHKQIETILKHSA